MMIKQLLLLLSVCSIYAQGNFDKQTKPIVEEGKMLFRSEMASWYGTDLFLEKYTDHSKIGGYVSYPDGEMTKCIFISKDSIPKVVGTISFESSFDLEKANLNLDEREITKTESAYLDLRNKAKTLINSDTIFKFYKDMNLNIIPIIQGKEKKVYVLTGPEKSGIVVFGNDYLIRFDSVGNVSDRKQLHKNIIPVEYADNGETVHNHLPETGDFITATDVCTLMLYGRFAKWKNHIVASKKYLSIWNCKTNELFVVTTEAARKITHDKD